MRLITWNINSVRLRMPLLAKLTAETKPDVVCLQETKVHDDQFPLKDIQELGYEHIHFRGMKGYNGVAILSQLPFEATDGQNWCNKQDYRHASVKVQGGVEIHNFYVPADGDVPDPDENEKFAHKLSFLEEMADWFTQNRKTNDKLIMVGDLNIAPLAEDVWSSKQLLKVVSHTPVETDALKKLIADGGWNDAVRGYFGVDVKLYSWWSYRARDWAASDRGRRLDHIWVSHDLADAVEEVSIHRGLRSAEKPSDHVPVVITI